MHTLKIKPQLSKVEAGMTLTFIRSVTDRYVRYGKKRKVYVIDVDGRVAKVALPTPLRNALGEIDLEKTFPSDGFKHCRYVEVSCLLRNCREVKDED